MWWSITDRRHQSGSSKLSPVAYKCSRLCHWGLDNCTLMFAVMKLSNAVELRTWSHQAAWLCHALGSCRENFSHPPVDTFSYLSYYEYLPWTQGYRCLSKLVFTFSSDKYWNEILSHPIVYLQSLAESQYCSIVVHQCQLVKGAQGSLFFTLLPKLSCFTGICHSKGVRWSPCGLIYISLKVNDRHPCVYLCIFRSAHFLIAF